jgi:hypothetical protein
MSTREKMFLGIRAQQVLLETDNLIAICVLIVNATWDPHNLTIL